MHIERENVLLLSNLSKKNVVHIPYLLFAHIHLKKKIIGDKYQEDKPTSINFSL